MQKRILTLSIVICLLLAGVGLASAAPKHILLLAKPEQTALLSDYLKADFQITVANEADLLDPNSELFRAEAMASYDAFIVGEIVLGAGFNGATVMDADLQAAIKDRVNAGAGFVHIGGWCSYQGGNADWSGQWHGTPIDEILPVNISSNWDTNDDGCDIPRLNDAKHPIVAGLDWRAVQRIGGYNKVTAAEGSTVIMTDSKTKLPLIVAGTYGSGTTVAYTGGLAGGWDQDFIKWSDFPKMWLQIATFITE